MNLERVLGMIIFPDGEIFDFGKQSNSMMTLTEENYHDPAFKRLLCNPNFIKKLQEHGFKYSEETIHVLAVDYAAKGIITLINLSYIIEGRKNNIYCFYLPQVFSKNQMQLLNEYKSKFIDLGKIDKIIIETMAFDKAGNDVWTQPIYNLQDVYNKIEESYNLGKEINEPIKRRRFN